MRRAFLLALAIAAPAASDVPAFELPPRDQFSATVERPLFSPGRRALSGEPSAGPATVQAGNFQLIGLARDEKGRAVALVRDAAAGTQFRVMPGDTLNGWKVDRIAAGALVLSAAGQDRSVPLGEPLPAAP